MNKIQFKSKKDTSKFLAEKGIDTSNWTEKKWLKLNKGQAEIHMMTLAEAMWDCYNENTPNLLQKGEYHIPLGDNINDIDICGYIADTYSVTPSDFENYTRLFDETRIQIAVARCARISYQTLGDNPKIDYKADVRLYDDLIKSRHASPTEHIALCTDDSNWYGNFKGWNQYRKILEAKNLLY